MKSIFKKIAFVLALAMVVTMMPTKAAAAAESDGPQMYSTLKLYLGGDVTETTQARDMQRSGTRMVTTLNSNPAILR